MAKTMFDPSHVLGRRIVGMSQQGVCEFASRLCGCIEAEVGSKVKVCKLNVDDHPDIAQRFGVFSIPTLIAFRDGKQISKAVGVQSKEQLIAMLG